MTWSQKQPKDSKVYLNVQVMDATSSFKGTWKWETNSGIAAYRGYSKNAR